MGDTRRLKRGIYLLPTAFTVGNLFCGFSSIAHASLGNIEHAAVLIVIAAVLDGLDGRIARLTGTTSEFGVQFDSMADIVSFGLAPAMLCFHWGVAGRMGWAVAFLYVVSAAMRLARFNLQKTVSDRKYFAGLASPMAACALASVVFAFPSPGLSSLQEILMAGLIALIALLMVSTLRYRSFKEVDLRNRRSYIYALPLAAVLVGVVTNPKASLLAMFSVYLVSAPAYWLWQVIVRGKLRPDPSSPVSELADDAPLR